MCASPSEVYVRQLLPKKNGLPLLVPEPYDNLPPEYRETGVRIGDVGIHTDDGSFDFLFNVCVSADDPINSLHSVPDGFEPEPLVEAEISTIHKMHKRGCVISSATVKQDSVAFEGGLQENEYIQNPVGVGMSYKFTSSSREAAFLALPDGASRRDIRNKAKFLQYAQSNAMRWYEFANGRLGREAANGSLYLVTGCDKSTTWAAGSHSSALESNDLSFKFTIAKVGELGAAFSYSWDTDSSTTVRTGPEISSSEQELQNQCNFIRGFRVSVREGARAALMGSAKLSSIMDSKSSNLIRGAKGRNIPFGFNAKRPWPNRKHTSNNEGGYNTPECDNDVLQSDGLTDSSDDDEIVTLECTPGVFEDPHPLTAINDHLLETNPGANIIVTHDDDLCSLMGNDEELPSDEELILRIGMYEVVDGCVVLRASGSPNDERNTRGKKSVTFNTPLVTQSGAQESADLTAWQWPKYSGSNDPADKQIDDWLSPPYGPMQAASEPIAINFKLGYSFTPTFILDVSLHHSTIRLNNGRSRIPSHVPESILMEKATAPPTEELVIIGPIPWKLVIKSKPGFCVTIHDVLEQLYLGLRKPVTQAEYAQQSNKSQQDISRAFLSRTDGDKDDMKKGLKRVDFLKGNNWFKGFVQSEDGHIWRMETSVHHPSH